jgi:hypothetical protein
MTPFLPNPHAHRRRPEPHPGPRKAYGAAPFSFSHTGPVERGPPDGAQGATLQELADSYDRADTGEQHHPADDNRRNTGEGLQRHTIPLHRRNIAGTA